jgi:hypothetical protein
MCVARQAELRSISIAGGPSNVGKSELSEWVSSTTARRLPSRSSARPQVARKAGRHRRSTRRGQCFAGSQQPRWPLRGHRTLRISHRENRLNIGHRPQHSHVASVALSAGGTDPETSSRSSARADALAAASRVVDPAAGMRRSGRRGSPGSSPGRGSSLRKRYAQRSRRGSSRGHSTDGHLPFQHKQTARPQAGQSCLWPSRRVASRLFPPKRTRTPVSRHRRSNAKERRVAEPAPFTSECVSRTIARPVVVWIRPKPPRCWCGCQRTG